jgi:hypothetical protein
MRDAGGLYWLIGPGGRPFHRASNKDSHIPLNNMVEMV